MSDSSQNLTLPYILPSQAQKHVTHNEALRILDALVHISIVSIGENIPPMEIKQGACYAIGPSPGGAWAGQAGSLATWQDETWAFFEPRTGWLAWYVTNDELLVFDGTDWVATTLQPDELQNLQLAGIGATADENNRLTVASPGTLFTHTGSGHQLRINKNDTSDIGSLLFQTNFNGRAEVGLTGDDNLHVKVSSDNIKWYEALTANRNDGSITFPTGIRHPESGAILRSQIFTPGGNQVSTIWRFDEARTGFPRQSTIDSISNDLITLLDSPLYGANIGATGPVANKTFFRNDTMEGLSYLRLWNISKTPAESCWIRASSGTSGLLVIDATHIAGWQAGETIQLGEPTVNSARVVAVDVSQFLAHHTGTVFRQAGLALAASVSAQGSGGWLGHIGVTPDGSGGSFTNVTSASSDHETGFTPHSGQGGGFINGFAQVGTTVLSPISNSNLLFVRESDDGSGALRIGALTVSGVWV